MNVIIFIIILLVLVLVHEFGHFWSAKKFGIRVDEFGFGFPPKIFGVKKGKNGEMTEDEKKRAPIVTGKHFF